jgi:hypothetical protein
VVAPAVVKGTEAAVAGHVVEVEDIAWCHYALPMGIQPL